MSIEGLNATRTLIAILTVLAAWQLLLGFFPGLLAFLGWALFGNGVALVYCSMHRMQPGSYYVTLLSLMWPVILKKVF